MRKRHRLIVPVCAVCCFVVAACTTAPVGSVANDPAPVAISGAPADGGGNVMVDKIDWSELERLKRDQQYQAAAGEAARLKNAAVAAGDEEPWTRALVEETSLRLALHGYETAVQFLLAEPRPKGAVPNAVLDLYLAHALVTYGHAYSWEIRQRERLSDDSDDPATWTMDRIAEEAHRAYLRVWRQRSEWGDAPLGDVARYVQQNTYPPRIRGTLRDAVAYLWVGLLADNSLWRPEQDHEIFRLDFGQLLEGTSADTADDDLADPEGHPLTKISHLLTDLEGWHAKGRRSEAALEARLELVRRLNSSAEVDEDRTMLREHLRDRLEVFDRGLEWWSYGIADLAQMMRDGKAQDAAVKARDLARQGWDMHPESAAGSRCERLVVTLEAPVYSLESMQADGLERRSIQVTHRNLGRLYLRAYRLDLRETIESADDRYLKPSTQTIEALLATRRPDAEWSVELPPTPDLKSHRTFVTPPLDQPGLWVVAASVRADFEHGHNQMAAVNLILGDLVLLVRPIDEGFDVTVRSGSTGEPVVGAGVELWRYDWQSGHQRVTLLTTGDDGRAKLARIVQGQYFLLATHGGDAALYSGRLWPGSFTQKDYRSEALLYTDRSVYRPGQTVHFKVVAYEGDRMAGRYITLAGRTGNVTLVDANYETVAEVQVTTNRFGSASGSFTIPPGRVLGRWLVRSSLHGEADIRVEEYKRPTFVVELSEPADALRLNRVAHLAGEARYYFGLPVTDGDVDWQITREPIYPRWWWWPQPETTRIVASGSSDLDSDGRFELEFTPEADERLAESGVSYRYRLKADVTGPSGETRSGSRVFRLGFVTVEARIESVRGFLSSAESTRLMVYRADLDGVPQAGEAEWRLVALEQPTEVLLPADQPRPEPPDDEAYRTPGDLQRPRWERTPEATEMLGRWEDGREVVRGQLEHGAQGQAELDLGRLQPGAYRLHYRTTDAFGAVFETRRELVVTGTDGVGLALPMVLEVEAGSVAVGGTARLLVGSGVRDLPMVLEIFRSGMPIQRRELRGAGAPEIVEIPVDDDLRGGFGVVLSALNDHQHMILHRRVQVPWDDRRLEVSFSSFRDLMRPGERETFTVKVTGADGAEIDRGAAELLAYMYDRSLDIFATHRPARPLELYPDRTSVGWVQASLGSAPAAWGGGSGLRSYPSVPRYRKDRLKVLDGYPIGGPGRRGGIPMPMAARMMDAPAGMGVAEADGAVEEKNVNAEVMMTDEVDAAEIADDASEPQLRQNFAETAFFEPHLLLEADGSASIEFEVPDSVTEWNLWVHALTNDLRSGWSHQTTRSVKELMVRPAVPRFLREGDLAELAVVVDNAGEEVLEGSLDFVILDPENDEVLLDAFGLDAASALGVPFSVKPGSSETLTFPIQVPSRLGTVAFKVTAEAGDLTDGELRPLPVLPGRMHLVQSRFATLRDRDHRKLHFADLAADADPTLINDRLVVTVDAQLFQSVLAALPYLVEFPHECTEQTLNRYLSTGIVSQVFAEHPAVAEMARRFAKRETRFEPWEADDPNRRMMLEETPWLRTSRGGTEAADDLINVLDPEIAKAHRDAAISRLEDAQTASGGFPWWPGGPPSPYMTLYILFGLSKGLELGVEPPRQQCIEPGKNWWCSPRGDTSNGTG